MALVRTNHAPELIHAIHSGDINLLENLCKRRVNLDVYFRNVTPLSAAVRTNSLPMVQMLVEHGASLNLHSMDQCDRIEPPLVTATRLGNTDIVHFLIVQNADLNAKDFYGHTALWFAADRFRLDLMWCLIVRGAQLNYALTSVECPLYQVTQYSHTTEKIEAVHMLVASGINLDHINSKMQNPLYWCMKTEEKELFRFLVAAGAKVKNWPWINDMPDSFVHDTAFMEWFEMERTMPPPLKRIAMVTVRKHISNIQNGTDITSSIKMLGLPTILTNYLLCRNI